MPLVMSSEVDVCVCRMRAEHKKMLGTVKAALGVLPPPPRAAPFHLPVGRCPLRRSPPPGVLTLLLGWQELETAKAKLKKHYEAEFNAKVPLLFQRSRRLTLN
eukprot:851865-Rhodomonas_salina.4